MSGKRSLKRGEKVRKEMDKKKGEEMEMRNEGEEKGKGRKLSKAELLRRERRIVGRV